ncbi:hypothetical protein I2I05_19945 [Hymenobacter sp. BT683]|uniref:Uncharacterized protein n=1 Tax=Hymenobacter jeongseonensis TaxID=2791027 RepID=A0ABS0IMV3_9BACT|nr:hypothetical protein [Hymenobacter jeongseonensis]MBF9239676.1 hypothetical protein [Hymenobacter jeongseonensis]
MKKCLPLLLALGCAPLAMLAQARSWNPAGADLVYPRTLLKAAALPGVRASLNAPDRLSIYQGLWNDVQAPPPTDNTSVGSRRVRATLMARARGLLESINTNV